MTPKLTRKDIEELLRLHGVKDQVALVGIRGYYLDSQGKKGVNDRGMYDDAIFVVSPRRFAAFRANTDPSIYRPGIATLKAGVHRYYKGKHKGLYWSLRLVGEQAPVTRDGQTGTKTGIALNIHKGGYRTTGSEGCQTLMPSDWDEFIELVYDEMDAYGQKSVPYLLVDEVERRQVLKVSATEPAVLLGTENSIQTKLPENVGASSVPAPFPPVQSPNPQPPAANPAQNAEVIVNAGDVKNVPEGFKPETITQYIPKITKSKWLLGGLSFTGLFSTIGAKLAGMPDWLVFLLGFLSGIAFSGFVWLIVTYHKQIFGLVQKVVETNADPTQNNIQLVQEKP